MTSPDQALGLSFPTTQHVPVETHRRFPLCEVSNKTTLGSRNPTIYPRVTTTETEPWTIQLTREQREARTTLRHSPDSSHIRTNHASPTAMRTTTDQLHHHIKIFPLLTPPTQDHGHRLRIIARPPSVDQPTGTTRRERGTSKHPSRLLPLTYKLPTQPEQPKQTTKRRPKPQAIDRHYT